MSRLIALSPSLYLFLYRGPYKTTKLRHVCQIVVNVDNFKLHWPPAHDGSALANSRFFPPLFPLKILFENIFFTIFPIPCANVY